MKKANITFLISVGPTLLLFEMMLLFISKKLLPVWSSFHVLSVVLSFFIIYLSIKELKFQSLKAEELVNSKTKDVSNMQGLLEEINQINKEKIELLENDLDVLEIEKDEKAKHTENQLVELRSAYEKLFDESAHNKTQASSLHNSLDDALDELRNLRQAHYLLKEQKSETTSPSYEINHQHKQLREQFEEKKEVLEKTRLALFEMEGKLMLLQKEKEEAAFEMDPIQEKLIVFLKQNDELKEEISSLEEIITTLSNRKKATRSTKEKKLETLLELQF